MQTDAKPTSPPVTGLGWLRQLLLAAFALAIISEMVMPNWMAVPVDGFIIVVSALVVIVAQTHRLPLQNVLVAADITTVVGCAAHGLSAKFALPFGPLMFGKSAGPQIFHCISWLMPFLWVTAVFSSRGVGRLVLRPWRKIENYGYWLMGVTAVLTVGFVMALEPFACKVRHLWAWQPTKITHTWYTATPLTFIVWALVTLLILVLATPSLVKKTPSRQSLAPDLAPLFVWLGMMVMFGVGATTAQLWPAVILDAVLGVIVTAMAVRGARW